MDFWRVVDILNKRKWLIIASVVVTGLLTYGATLLSGSRYVATVTFDVPVRTLANAGIAESPDVGRTYDQDMARTDAAYYQAVMQSGRVVAAARTAVQNQIPYDDLLANTEVQSIGRRIFLLRVTHSNPGLAGAAANAMAKEFVQIYKEHATQSQQDSVDFLQQQIDETDVRLAKERGELDKARNQHRIADTLANSIEYALGRQTSARSERDDLMANLAQAQAQLRERERQVAALPATISDAASPSDDPVAHQFQEAIASTDVQLTALRARYSEGHPEIVRLRNLRDSYQRRLNQVLAGAGGARISRPNPAVAAARRDIEEKTREIAGLQAQVASKDRNLASATAEVEQLKGANTGWEKTMSNITKDGEDRSSMVTRLNVARIALDAAKREPGVTIMSPVDDGNPARLVTLGRTWKLPILAALCALLGVSGLLVALDSVDRRVRTLRQAEIVLPSKVIAAIPQPMGKVSYSTLARATELQPQSLHSESYRFLGLHLLSAHGPRARSLMVLSAKANQGSTTTLTNLAITLAQAGKKVIAVDANIRTAELHAVFGISNEFGFTDLVRSPANGSLERALHETSVPNLQVIPSGATPHNPWELFRSPNLAEVSRTLRDRADFVLYDTPSALLFTDALNLAPIVDAAFLCVRAQEPLTGAEQRLVQLLEQSDVAVLGSVLNDVPAEVVEGYHNYQHYYGTAVVDAPVLSQAPAERAVGAIEAGSVIDMSDEDRA